MADPTVTDMGQLAAEEAARRASPPKFGSAVEGIKGPTADEEAQMKAMFSGVTMENLNDTVKLPAQPGQLVVAPVIETPKVEVPAKFLKPDGTVDEEKLKTSSENLGKAIEQKQKTIDEMVAGYREQEKQFTELGQKTKQLKETSTPEPVAPPPNNFQGLTPQQIHANLLQQMNSDPIGVIVEIARTVSQKEGRDIAAPALEMAARQIELQRDADMRQNLVSIAERDPRIQDPALYQEFVNELNSDPAYFRLRNPQKAAWNEVKERLRLGEPSGSAQPSNTGSPVLGRGVPPSVSSLPTPMTPQTMQEQVSSLNPFSEDGKKMEAAMRSLAESTWRG